jgi:hypothetical protein
MKQNKKSRKSKKRRKEENKKRQEGKKEGRQPYSWSTEMQKFSTKSWQIESKITQKQLINHNSVEFIIEKLSKGKEWFNKCKSINITSSERRTKFHVQANRCRKRI